MTSARLRARTNSTGPRPVRDLTDLEFLDQKTFTRMLCLERKRVERSDRRFVLMLLEWEAPARSKRELLPAKKILQKLMLSTRDTDIKGWYKEDATIGVIFTEIGSGDGKMVANALLERVTTALSNTLSIDEIHQIRISFHLFPEEVPEDGDDRPPDLKLYPDETELAEKKRAALVLKRLLDIVGSVAAIACLSPVFLAIAVAIKLTSPGPVFFRQKRMGRLGRQFTFLKFRSMQVKNDESIHREFVSRFISGDQLPVQPENPAPVFKIQNDPRVTPIGRFLRRTSLDELPQFFNVLVGDMSIVGPRPPIPYEYACYDTWHRRRLLAVRPGITGLWQICGRSRVKFDEMVRLDLRYAQSWSLWLDLKILLRTPAAVFVGNGAC